MSPQFDWRLSNHAQDGCTSLYFHQYYLRVPMFPYPPQHLSLPGVLIHVNLQCVKWYLVISFCIFRSTLNTMEIIPLTVVWVPNTFFSPKLLYVSWSCLCFYLVGWSLFPEAFEFYVTKVTNYLIFGFYTLRLSWEVLHFKVIKRFTNFSSRTVMVSLFAFKYLIYFELILVYAVGYNLIQMYYIKHQLYFSIWLLRCLSAIY